MVWPISSNGGGGLFSRRATQPIVVSSVDERRRTGPAVSCQKGKPIRKAKPGDWRCKECGFVTSKKKKICEPKKVKK